MPKATIHRAFGISFILEDMLTSQKCLSFYQKYFCQPDQAQL